MILKFSEAGCDRKLQPTFNVMRFASPDSNTKQAAVMRALFLVLFISLSIMVAGKSVAAEHVIEMIAEETDSDDGLGNKLLAYRMISHSVDGVDISSRYSSVATIPGPTIILTEGDKVNLTLFNDIPDDHSIDHPSMETSKQVSVHVHGVHYDIISDGTLKVINKNFDEGAGVGPEDTFVSYQYTWDVASGTAGTWPYHDHNFESHNGSETKGMFGAVIVNPPGSPAFAKEYVLYLGDDAFWGDGN